MRDPKPLTQTGVYMEVTNYTIHGGVVQNINTNGGYVYIYGGLVEEIDVQGGDVVLRGGIINNLINARMPKPETVIREKIVEKVVEKVVYRDSPKVIEELRKWKEAYDALDAENIELRNILQNGDNLLIEEINDLKEKLKKARDREKVLVMQRNEALAREEQDNNIWDDYKPSKEEVKRVYNTMCAFTECDEE